MSELWQSTIPEYATGFGTIVLAVATGALLWVDRRKDRRSALRDARKVFAIALAADDPLNPTNIETIMIVNAGADPIFNVGAGSYAGDAIPRTYTFQWRPGTHQSSLPFVLPAQERFLAGEWIEPVDGSDYRPAQLLYWMYPQLNVLVTWVDGQGVRWQRISSREPSRIGPGR